MRLAFVLLAATVFAAQAKLNPELISRADAEAYLERFGYLAPRNPSRTSRSLDHYEDKKRVFDALARFQKMTGLNVTGELDIATKKKMTRPRCGVIDVQAYSKTLSRSDGWEKNDLTYQIDTYTRDLSQQLFKKALQEAFDTWSAVTPLTFTYVPSQGDITVKFGRREHGDPWPFDGKGNVLAHATLPNSGMRGLLHFDDDETWTYKDAKKLATEEYMDVVIVAVHEIGHALGLEHSEDENAIMGAYYQEPTDENGNYKQPTLQKDDIKRIQAIYGSRTSGENPPRPGVPGEPTDDDEETDFPVTDEDPWATPTPDAGGYEPDWPSWNGWPSWPGWNGWPSWPGWNGLPRWNNHGRNDPFRGRFGGKFGNSDSGYYNYAQKLFRHR